MYLPISKINSKGNFIDLQRRAKFKAKYMNLELV